MKDIKNSHFWWLRLSRSLDDSGELFKLVIFGSIINMVSNYEE
jgi:hypothetical protein